MSSGPALGPAVSSGSRPRTGWGQAAAWGTLALCAQAAALRLIDAGKLVHYQHYRPLLDPALAAVIGIEALAVLAGLFRHRLEIGRWLGQFRWWQLASIAAAVALPAVAASRDPREYAVELAFGAAVQLVALGNLALFAMALPERAVAGAAHWFGGRGFVAAAALWVTLGAALLNVAVYQRFPHIEDEVGYYVHARMLAAGHLSLPAPPVPKAFDVPMVDVQNGRWFVVMPPGWPAVLALGFLAGAPWLVNPVLAGLNVLLCFLFLRDLYGPRTARLAVLLMALSPWYLFLAMSMMTHIFATTCALAAALGVERARKRGLQWAVLAGAGAGMATLIRPLEGVILALLLGLWALGLGGKRLRAAALAVFAAAAALTGGLNLAYNQHFTGNPKVFPLMAFTDRIFGKDSNALGFGPNRGWPWPLDPFPGHGWRDVVVNSELNTFGLNTELFGWATGSLLLAAALAVSRKTRRTDRAMFAAVAAVVVGHAFYWFSGGPDFGARYWFLVFVPLLALSARGIEALEELRGGRRMLAAVLALCAMTAVNYLPWRASDKYYHYLRMRPDLIKLAGTYEFGKSLVLVRGERFPDYAAAVVLNPLNLDSPATVYAWDASPEVRRQVVRAFADRPVWIVDGPTLTPDGRFRVEAGPLPAKDLM
jgi:4-amino-4-deoxy-L-arabinose transferase-like glycosyltransferase